MMKLAIAQQCVVARFENYFPIQRSLMGFAVQFRFYKKKTNLMK